MTAVPWVIEGEQGPSTLTFWRNDRPIAHQSVCATCGWSGQLRLFTPDEEPWQHGAMQAADLDGTAHTRATGHDWRPS